MDKKKTYYELMLDAYHQPNGIVQPVKLTKKEFEQRQKDGHWIYENEDQATYRAMD